MVGINVEWMPGPNENDVGGLGYAQESGFHRINLEHKAMNDSIYLPGEWNEMSIEARGNHVTTILNGEVITYRDVDPQWIDDSGKIGFQVHIGSENDI